MAERHTHWQCPRCGWRYASPHPWAGVTHRCPQGTWRNTWSDLIPVQPEETP